MSYMNDIASGGAYGGFFGAPGAYGALLKGLGRINPMIQQEVGQSQGFISPYNQIGQKSLQDYFNQLMQMNNPQQYMSNILSHYQESPAVQEQRRQGLNAISTSAAAKGLLGSGAQARGMQTFGQHLTDQGQQQYLKDILGIQGQQFGGLQNLSGLGETAGAQMGQFGMEGMQDMANIMAQQAQAQAAQKQATSSAWGSALGAALSFL